MVAQNKAQHTPGPWRAWIIAQGVTFRQWRIGSEGKAPGVLRKVALLADTADDVSPEEAHANARLIESAPDLLEACLAAQEGTGDWRALVDLAIARATGTPTAQGTAAAVAEALGRSPAEPGTARLAADLEGGAK